MKNNIKLFRVKFNMTQGELAKAIQVSRQTVSAMEGGKYVPSTMLALKLSEKFEVSVNELFILEEEDYKK